jgi:hypothetical protein
MLVVMERMRWPWLVLVGAVASVAVVMAPATSVAKPLPSVQFLGRPAVAYAASGAMYKATFRLKLRGPRKVAVTAGILFATGACPSAMPQLNSYGSPDALSNAEWYGTRELRVWLQFQSGPGGYPWDYYAQPSGVVCVYLIQAGHALSGLPEAKVYAHAQVPFTIQNPPVPTTAQAQTLAGQSNGCDPTMGCAVASFGPCILAAEHLDTSGPPGGPASYTTYPDLTCLYLTNTTNSDTSSADPPSGGGEVDLGWIAVELANGSDTPAVDSSGGPLSYLGLGDGSVQGVGGWGNDPLPGYPNTATEASAEAQGNQVESQCEQAIVKAASGSGVVLDSSWTG